MERMACVVALALLAIERETAIISALAALIVSGVVMSIGAWMLLRRERRQR
jgi:hypothetical protein